MPKLAGPAGVAAARAQLIFQVGQSLLQFGDFVFLRLDLRVLIGDVFARILLGKRLLWIAVVLRLKLLRFALQNVEFLFGLADLRALFREALAPSGFAIVGSLVVLRRRSVALLSCIAVLGVGWSGCRRCWRRSRCYVVIRKNFFRLRRILLLLAGFTGSVSNRIAGLLRGV